MLENTHILLDVLLCSIAEYILQAVPYFGEPLGRYIFGEPLGRIFIYGESVTEVCEAERNWRGKSSQLIGQQQTNLSNRSSGVQIPRDICTRLGRYLYYTRCSWIIKVNI